MNFLPKEGVHGTLYLYRLPSGDWGVVTWDGGQYHQHRAGDTLEAIRRRADELLWAKSWPRIECKAPTTKMKPCVRVEFEYEDGRIQRLTGDDAKLWMEEVNNVIGLAHLRYSTPPLSDHPWEWDQK